MFGGEEPEDWHGWWVLGSPDKGESLPELVFWQRQDDAHLVGALVNRSRLMADVIAHLPASGPQSEDLPTGRIRLLDGEGRLLYLWGADDFIVKPFGVREVLARIRPVARRCVPETGRNESDEPFEIGDLEVLPSQLRARRGEEVIDLSPRDVSILRLLAQNEGRALDRNTIYNECWGLDYMPNSRSLDQHISQLRKRIEIDPRNPRIIQTVHAVGYRYDGMGQEDGTSEN